MMRLTAVTERLGDPFRKRRRILPQTKGFALDVQRNYTMRMPDDDLVALLESVRSVPMTPEETEQQRRSFTYGNVQIENPRVTREFVDRVADEDSR